MTAVPVGEDGVGLPIDDLIVAIDQQLAAACMPVGSAC